MQKRIAALEGDFHRFGPGREQYLTLISLTRPSDNIVASSYLYGGTYTQLVCLLPCYNITTKFIISADLADFAAVIDDKTKAIYIESISNPDLLVPGVEAVAKVAHDHGFPLIASHAMKSKNTWSKPSLTMHDDVWVDNTLGAGGYFVRPIEHGADIVVHSATERIGGYETTIAGVIIDSGRFDWARNGAKFIEMVEPSPVYRGLSYAPALVQRHSSCAPLPISLETLALRAERHAQNAAQLAAFFEAHPQYVSWILWPGSDKHASHDTMQKYLKRGFGGMLNVGVKGGAE